MSVYALVFAVRVLYFGYIWADECLLVGETLTVFYGHFLIICSGFVEKFGDAGGFSVQKQDDR